MMEEGRRATPAFELDGRRQGVPYDDCMKTVAAETDLARRLVQAPSPSGRESPAAQTLLSAFGELGFDEGYLDDAGNALGIIRRGNGPTLMFNGHIDTVPEGDPGEWAQPPLSGAIEGGLLWGRGSCDMKSALACMTLAASDAAAAGFTGTLVVAGVVQEEVGGLGARFLATEQRPDVIVLGEPSDLQLKLGHRGRIELQVQLPGRIAHAAKAELGENALYRAARYLERLEKLDLPRGGPLGASTATPTGIRLFPGGANVVPGRAEITIDYRSIVGDDGAQVVGRLQRLDPEARVSVGEEDAVSENGKVRKRFPRISLPYLLPEGAPVELARETVRAALAGRGLPYGEGTWWFATDAPYLADTGAPVIGFGPGDPELAHTTKECVPLDHLATARDVYTRLALSFLSPA